MKRRPASGPHGHARAPAHDWMRSWLDPPGFGRLLRYALVAALCAAAAALIVLTDAETGGAVLGLDSAVLRGTAGTPDAPLSPRW